MSPRTSEPLQQFGTSLHQLILDLPERDAITDTLDYLLGALYGLSRAQELEFRDRATGQIQSYSAYLANDALAIAKGQPINQPWLAGFYFNSSIQRLASAFDRIPRMLGAKMETTTAENGQQTKKRRTTTKERMAEVNPENHVQWTLLYDEVNDFKHEPEGRTAGRGVTMADALAAYDQTIALLKKSAPSLKARYK
jgi:hypothetical protein